MTTAVLFFTPPYSTFQLLKINKLFTFPFIIIFYTFLLIQQIDGRRSSSSGSSSSSSSRSRSRTYRSSSNSYSSIGAHGGAHEGGDSSIPLPIIISIIGSFVFFSLLYILWKRYQKYSKQVQSVKPDQSVDENQNLNNHNMNHFIEQTMAIKQELSGSQFYYQQQYFNEIINAKYQGYFSEDGVQKQTTYQLKFEPSGVVKGDAQNGDGIFQISGFYLKSGDEFNVKIVLSQFQVEIDQETCDFNQESVENVIQKSQFYAIVSFTGECVEKEDECWELPKSLKGTYSSTSKKYGEFSLQLENSSYGLSGTVVGYPNQEASTTICYI
eukprot:TRINITY_DN13591_c0_g1_i3.p1 TRINITY_DN13591_c0_g1~~TRINITY_DN13591_c0_g1_i3.p1  ORF type:complete len:352 (+),score=28.99 TRINITY_DN13591_c0_g1_i3:81-1058(+)